MGKKSAKKKTRREEKSTTQKGKLLEEIVAGFHEGKGAKVERNVRIPVGASHKKREIDVLLTSHIAGYPIQVPIECKNEAAHRRTKTRRIYWETESPWTPTPA
jgi:hypothetical protein